MKKILSMLMVISILMTISITGASALSLDNIQISDEPGVIEDFLNDDNSTGFVFGYIGDTNRDLDVNVKDATAIQKHVADLEYLPTEAILIGDVDGDGRLTVKDATAVQKYIAEIPVDFPIKHVMYLHATIDEAVIGKWEVTMDVAEIVNSVFGSMIEDPMLLEYINISSYEIKATYEFKADGMYTVTPDEAFIIESHAKVKAEFKEDYISYLNAVSEEYDLGITAEEMIQAMGYASIDEYVAEVFPQDLIEEIVAPIESTYFAADGEIFLDGSNLDYYEYYTIDGNTLTITGNNLDEYPEGYPIVMTRIG